MRKTIGLAAALTAALVCSAVVAKNCDQEDLQKGERVFMRCKACHTVEQGKNRVGPSLYGIVGRPVASEPGYNYSSAMKTYGNGDAKWTKDRLMTYLADPRKVVPGTKMSFAGLPKDDEREHVVCYLDQFH